MSIMYLLVFLVCDIMFLSSAVCLAKKKNHEGAGDKEEMVAFSSFVVVGTFHNPEMPVHRLGHYPTSKFVQHTMCSVLHAIGL